MGLTSRTNMPARMAQGATKVKGPTYIVICVCERRGVSMRHRQDTAGGAGQNTGEQNL
jgi:hypothetical protein